jgi:hypothetical protein
MQYSKKLIILLLFVSCSQKIIQNAPSLKEELLMSAYSILLLDRSVNKDLQSNLTAKLDSNNLTYFIDAYNISITDEKDTLKYRYDGISIIPKKNDLQNERMIIKYTGDIPETGIVEVELQRLFNEVYETVNFKYILEGGEIK